MKNFLFFNASLDNQIEAWFKLSLVVLSVKVHCYIKSIIQFFLFGKPKSQRVLSEALMRCFSKLTCAIQNLKD